MAVEFPTVNGRKYGYSSIELSILRDGQAAQIFIEVTAVNYDDTLEEALMYGAATEPLGRTRGVYNPGEATLTISKQSEAVLVDQLGDGYMEKEIGVSVKYSDTGLPLITDELLNCRITGLTQAHAQGPDALMTDVKLKPMLVTRNGKTPLENHIR